MFKAKLRPEETDRLIRPLASLGLDPIAWTLLAVLPAIAGFVMLYLNNLPLGLALFLMAGAFDLVDGAVARVMNKVTTFGAYIDGILDRYVEFLLYLGLMFYLGPAFFLGMNMEIWFMLLVFGALMTTFARAYADHRGLVKDQQKLKSMGGLLERGERLALMYVGMLLSIFMGQEILELAIVVTALLANLTTLQRIASAIKYGMSKA
ncbi:MAG: CDP-alcohol phosphatidyltransferase family protein [Methanotrichaceae archaeon]|nr:CDP-alcohol phosphatidyltransferase family protein [Methanotrichaceae archaeon]